MISKKLSMSELHHLHGRKHESETRKRDLINYLEKLKEAYRKKQISYARYLEIIHHKRDGRTIEEWIHFYHFESLECHKRIKQHHSHVGKKTHLIFLLACIVGLFLISLIFNNSNFVGFFTQDENASQIIITPYTQGLNINFSENSEYELQLENPGQLNSVRLSGAIQGDGEAKIYLNNILILDTSTLKTGTRTITGLVAENKTKDEKEEKDKEEKVKDDEVTGEVEETQEDTESDGTRDIPIEELEPEIPTIPAEEINETPVEEENQTEVPDSEQEPSSEPETEIRTRTFTDICEESCNLESLNLNESSYTLRIEIDSATINLDEIRYSIIKYPEEAPEEPEEIPTEQEPETPVEEENETLIRELLQESVSQNSSLDIDTTPLDNTTFAMIYASEDKSVYFRVYNTNGTILSNSTIDSTNQPLYPRVAISAINQTHFVVAWINDHDTANNIANITLAIYDINGDKLTGDIIVDDNIAQATADNHFTDLSITQMGDRFVIGWRDDSTDDAQLKIFDNSGNNLTGSILVDPTTAANDALTDTISVSAINSTSFVYGWFDQGVNDLAFNIYNETGGEAVARVNVNPSAATDSRLSIAGLDNDKFVYAFYLSNDQDIGYTIIYKNGTSLIENTIIETNAGPTTGTWLDVAAIKSENYANDSFVLIWYNATAGNIVGATYYGNGTNIATFTIDTEENANYHLMSVVAKESVTGQQICPGTFIVAYSNSSNITTLKQYYINGTIWDGSCGAAVDNSPNVTLSLPEDNYYNDSSSPVNVTFQCNATDDYQLVNMSLYITDSTNSSFALNQTTAISGTSNSTSWNLSLINGNYTWNCLTYDNASQSDWADANRSLKINYTADITSPQINITYPQNTTYSVNVSALNYTYSDDNPGFCWYNNGTINSSAVVAGINFTNITSNEGSNTWTLYCNDTAGNSNQTDVQSFVVQSIPTSLAFSVNQTMYPQGRSPGAGYDIYIPFQARYLDSLGQPISGAICNVTNDETSDITSLTYNESSGNYTGNVSNYLMYDVVNFNVTCSKTNYNSSSNNTSTNVWLFAYLWEWENRSYGSANNYTTTWLRKESTQGNVYNFTEAISASIGENELSKMFYFCGAGTNCSFMKDYNMLGLHTLRLNVSVSNDTCQPYLCMQVYNFNLNPLIEHCDSPVLISANTPTLIEQNMTENYTISQNNYLVMHLHLNCSSAVSEQVTVYYNYTGQPANIEIKHAEPTQMLSSIATWAQIENNYTIGSNQNINVTRKWWITFNNTESSERYTHYFFKPQILADYPNSRINGTNYVWNSTGQLLASDNTSAGAPNIITTYTNNQISWNTEVIPGNTTINETLQAGIKDAIRNNETIYYNTTSDKRWNITLSSIFISQVMLYNVTTWTNYSAYGVPDDWEFNVTKTTNGNTTDITNDVIINTTEKTITMPLTDLSGTIVYTITAQDITSPEVHLISPANNTLTNQSSQTFSCNISNIEIANLTLKIWNSSNNLIHSNTTNLTGVFNQTNWTYNLPYDNSFKWNCLGYDANGNSNYSNEGNYTITLDATPPYIVFISPLNQNYISNPILINITNNSDAINIWWNNGTANLTYNSSLYYNFSEGSNTIYAYANDTLGNFNSTSVTFNLTTPTPPSVVILYPKANTVRQEDSYIAIMANITDSDGISSAMAEITYPNSTAVNISLYQPPQKDNFNFNTMGIVWKVENESIESNQICTANIDTTITDKAYTSISGNGTPNTDTYCSLVMIQQTIGDFDMNVSFNITNESGIDYAMLFKLTEISSSINASKNIFMSIGNWTGYGRNYDVFVNDGNISDYISERETNDTEGKFRIKRVNNTFTFYTWNNSDSSWFEETESEIDVYPGLFITLETESTETGWGNISVEWDDLETGINPLLYVGSFTDTSIQGDYNITIIANDTLGAVNNTEKTNFTIEEINDAPTTPFLLTPTPNEVISGIYNIIWSNVYDVEGDSLQFNITLLNPDLSYNATIISNYGNASSTSYAWNTSQYADENYSLRITVFENNTVELYNVSYTLGGNFTIDNTAPIILFVSPTPDNNSTLNQNGIYINATATDANSIDDYLLQWNGGNESLNVIGSDNNISLYLNKTGLADNSYTYSIYAMDEIENWGRSEIRNITIDAAPDINLTSNEGSELNYSVTIATDYGNGIYDLNITISDEDVENIFISGFNISGCSNITFESNTNETIGNNSYAISAECMIFDNMTLSMNATQGNYLYKCLDWNMTTLLCNDELNWTTAKLLTPGETYNITINSTDPGFIEVLQPNATLGKDTHIVQGTPNANYGADSTLDIRGDDARRILIEFNVSSIPANAIIDSAILTLYATAKGSSDAIVNVYRVNSTWTEGTGTGTITGNGATWNNRSGTASWDISGGDFDSNIWNNTTITAINTFFDWNLTDLVQNMVNGTLVNYGILLRTTTAGSGTTSFASSDNINSTRWPELNISYTILDNSPNVTLSLPLDNYYNDSSSPVNITFQCNATDDYQLTNISLYITDSTNSSFALNQTTAISGTSNSTSWNLSLINGNYTWNCLAYDNSSQTDWADTNRSLKINYTAPVNIAPNITYISPIANTNPIEASSTPITFYTTMCDENGVADLNDTSVKANFTRAGQATRENNSCILVSDINSTCANYSCTINMWYFDSAGNWNVSVSGKDIYENETINDLTYFTYNLLQAIVISPGNITFNVNASASNQTATNDPVIINNTGNYNMTDKIAINALNLLGETNASEYLAAENFSIGTADDCAGTRLQNATDTNITGVILQAGNLSLGGGIGQEQLYYCINEVGDVSSQTYSTQGYGSWLIKVILSLVMISTAKKKKRKIIVDDLSIPVSIFTDKIGGLEAIVKYLKENLELTYHEIALLLNRDDRTIWTAYNKSKIKMPEKLKISKTLVHIPTSIFKNRELTIFEAIVVYLKEKDMKFSEIADLLSRDQRNIWTIYNRTKK